MSEKERLRISAYYYGLVTGELEKEAQTYQLWIQSYPQDPIPHGNLGANFTALGQYDKSLRETQEAQRLAPNVVLNHRGIVLNFPLGALAQVGLARAYALQGDTTKARAAYQDFLALWKDADPDIPILKQAKAEYAKLQ